MILIRVTIIEIVIEISKVIRKKKCNVNNTLQGRMSLQKATRSASPCEPLYS